MQQTDYDAIRKIMDGTIAANPKPDLDIEAIAIRAESTRLRTVKLGVSFAAMVTVTLLVWSLARPELATTTETAGPKPELAPVDVGPEAQDTDPYLELTEWTIAHQTKPARGEIPGYTLTESVAAEEPLKGTTVSVFISKSPSQNGLVELTLAIGKRCLANTMTASEQYALGRLRPSVDDQSTYQFEEGVQPTDGAPILYSGVAPACDAPVPLHFLDLLREPGFNVTTDNEYLIFRSPRSGQEFIFASPL